MADWQRPARVGLASFAVTFAVTLLYSMSDRSGPPAASPVVPADPAAVLESSGARITLGDGSVITADRQFGYDDGSARLLGVEVVVPAGENRTGFRIGSGEAAGVEETGEWRLAGSVTIETEDGLAGSTSKASYADAAGIVTMPEPARFEQGWMRLEGDAARYDRRLGLVHLDRRAVVELLPVTDGDASRTRIAAGRAEVDRLAGTMRFTEGVIIDAGARRMQADTVVLRFNPEASRIDAMELNGNARMIGREGAGTDLREMSAQAIAVRYRDGELELAKLAGDARLQGGNSGPGQLRHLSASTIEVSYRGGASERATIAGGAQVALFGDRAGAAGVTIDGGFIEMALETGVAGIEELRARERVVLAFPAGEGGRRRIRAQTLDIGGGSATAPVASPANRSVESAAPVASRNGLAAVFEGNVEMRESGFRQAHSSTPDDRVMRSERLVAVLAEGLTQLTEARFRRNVTLEAGNVSARADRATYAPDEDLFTLAMRNAASPAPRMDDERGFVQARTISIALDGPNIEATRDVKGVLGGLDADDPAPAVRPGLFAAGDPIHFVAGRFSYDAGRSLATYDAGARLWQGSTEFRGRKVVIDETTGNIAAEGAVRTRTTMLQQEEAENEAVETATIGNGGTLFYDDVRRQVTYTMGARLSNPGFTLESETIDLFLREDARTLDRIRAADGVALDLETRSVTAAALAYDDGEGRYDLTGEPVSVVEQRAGECRETTGRSVTFYRTGDSISADGQSAERTASASGTCAARGSTGF